MEVININTDNKHENGKMNGNQNIVPTPYDDAFVRPDRALLILV